MTDFDGGCVHWAATGPLYYVTARLHWDHMADVETLLNEYYQAFGSLAPVVRVLAVR